MARWDFKLPDIGEGVAEGEIVAWADGIAIGALVKADAPLAEVMTDKATVTITSPKTGTIVELGGNVGEVIKVHSTLVVLELDANAPAAVSAPPAPAAPPAASAVPKHEPAATAVGDIKEDLPGMRRVPAPTPAPAAAAPAAPSGYFADKPLATPATPGSTFAPSPPPGRTTASRRTTSRAPRTAPLRRRPSRCWPALPRARQLLRHRRRSPRRPPGTPRSRSASPSRGCERRSSRE